MKLQNRKSIRLQDYDYSGEGVYFITICIRNRECLLGEVKNEVMEANAFSLIADELWKDLPNHYPALQLGAWMVMPNHFHGILILTGVGAIQELPSNTTGAILESSQRQRRKMLLAKIIGRFKMTTGKQINLIQNTSGGPLWQRNYYEHIIRNGQSLINIENYILSNPSNWNTDRENTGRNERIKREGLQIDSKYADEKIYR